MKSGRKVKLHDSKFDFFLANNSVFLAALRPWVGMA